MVKNFLMSSPFDCFPCPPFDMLIAHSCPITNLLLSLPVGSVLPPGAEPPLGDQPPSGFRLGPPSDAPVPVPLLPRLRPDPDRLDGGG